MKKIQLLAALLMAVIAISCGKKKESKDIIVPSVEVVKPKAPISMQPYPQQQEVKWLDKSYQVFIDRVADDSLRMVQDETGQKFVDNRITLRVIRADGRRAVLMHSSTMTIVRLVSWKVWCLIRSMATI